MIIVDENGNNLIDPLNPDNIIEKVDMEIVCSDGKVIPMSWIPYEYISPSPPFPIYSVDGPYTMEYASIYNCVVIGYWAGDIEWESSFKIRIPEYNIELNVYGNNKYHRVPSHYYMEEYGNTWWVNGTECGHIPIEPGEYVNYKLTLPINTHSSTE